MCNAKSSNQRSKQMVLRVTQEEHEEIRRRAMAARTDVSKYIRDIALSGNDFSMCTRLEQDLLPHIASLSNRVNELPPDIPQKEGLSKEVIMIWQYLNRSI